jgi:site-specific DNA-cytosine methylase
VLTHVSLFSGIGGNELAAQWAGFQTVLMCEIDPFCRAVLRKHFPGIPICENCLHYQEFKVCSCRDKSELVVTANKCPDWMPEGTDR